MFNLYTYILEDKLQKDYTASSKIRITRIVLNVFIYLLQLPCKSMVNVLRVIPISLHYCYFTV